MSTPRATYRLQFSGAFGFRAAAATASYLEALGVSHVYASPYLKARPGSTHGYDIVAHEELNPELGSNEDFAAMHAQFASHGLGQILDFVPNHMGVGGADNPLWLNVLEWGPESRFAGWFDIDWKPASRYLNEKLLVPVLGEQYGAVLEDGKLVLKFDDRAGEFAVWAYDTHKLPVCPLHYGRILGNEHVALERLADEFGALLEWRPQIERRADDLKRELAELVAGDGQARASLERSLARLNGSQDAARRELDALIQVQSWRASHFRVAGDDINYRRFFNINDLAGLRMELPEVFEHTHRLVLRLLRQGVLDGLRIDHVDGLLDPRGYLQRLRAATNGAGTTGYLVVEKILARDESLREDWPVDGTTGYEFANLVTGLLIDAGGEIPMTRAYGEFAGEHRAFEDIVRECKLRIMRFEMSSELNVLARDTARVARQNPRTADFTRNLLRRAIRELVASFPIYRTYLNSAGTLDEVDRRYLSRALAGARRHERDIDASVFDFLEGLLTGALVNAPRSGFSRHAVLRTAMKFQQYSGPVMAKGLEDTAFYRYNRLLALNEVGGHPDHFGVSPADFHAANAARAAAWPHSLLATSTHDTKRGEDARARLAVLSEIPQEWHAQLTEWSKALHVASAALQDPNTEYFFYQLLLGSWPVRAEPSEIEHFRARAQQAMLKSVREAKVRTSWSVPDENYEHALASFVNAAFGSADFRRRFEPFQARVAALGMQNSLVQTTLKLTAPGVPDIYQGSELWNLSLVDPDNRRAVDYALRMRMLEEIERDYAADPAAAIRAWLDAWHDGRIKLWLTWRLLKLRRDHPRIFAGGYEPLEVTGPDSDRVIAFLRSSDGPSLVVAVARWPAARERDAGWRQASIPGAGNSAGWRDVLTGASCSREPPNASLLFAQLPVAILIREP
ncbi:MAG TPA: malto-oligosyltrehalose synthase [Steroidobacteraceae bacterium]|nr:malto-oligosyltrehalose synthase [Steroidobacteraceae bacterium]